MTFRATCQIGAAITLALFVVLLTHPPLVFWLFGIDGGRSAEMLTRRAAVLGVCVTLWMARDAVPSPARRAIAIGTAVTMLGLAVLGTVEVVRGAAGPGIWVAIGTEIGLGLAFQRSGVASPAPVA